jgi:membrane-associated protein
MFNLDILANPEHLISTVGTIGVIVIVFLETGLFFGFFFPGDSLLFTAGLLSTYGYVSFPWLLVGTTLAAILGDTVGYAFGRKVGPMLFTRQDSVIFNKKYIERAQHFYDKHGKKTIILARFIPIIRTFAPIVAGVANMRYRTFLCFADNCRDHRGFGSAGSAGNIQKEAFIVQLGHATSCTFFPGISAAEIPDHAPYRSGDFR